MVEIIKTEGLSFQYSLADKKSLNNIDLTIENGDFITLAGSSGSGKTTLLRQLKSELWPVGKREGRVLYQGEPIDELDARVSAQKIGMVFQSPDDQLVMDNVIQELAFSLENIGLAPDEIQKRIAELVNFLNLQDILYESVHNLSGGQKQMVNLAAVLILRPQVLLLDEPTAQLDPIATKEFISLLKRVHDELGIAVLISEHRLEDVIPLSNKLWLIDEGTMQYEGDVTGGLKAMWASDKLTNFIPDVPFVFLKTGLTDSNAISKLPLTVDKGKQILQNQQIDLVGNQAAPQATPGEETVKVARTSFEYTKNGLYVLDNLNLTVHKNEWLAIIGKNGTGKTTLLKVIMGILTPRRGSIKVLGKKLRSWKQADLYNEIGYLSQNPADYFTYDSIEEEFFNRAEQLKLDTPNEAAEGMMAELDLAKLRKQNPHDVSGGEQQLVALGLILMSSPRILLLDEPTKGLDPLRRLRLGKLIKQLQLDKQLSIIMVSHDMEFSARFADKCALIFDGEIVSEDEPHKFFAGNFFYTTVVNRLLRNQLPNIINREEVSR
ncbi:ABC transporter ATP-binding protein [Lentilactobacillus sp. Marseille-Q4993]|uniref:ABC transporter ATP-binding protein n=1 Tax=Lentilactobacillus sp. Marseille-Q4993 TaxID=3039492 RepID=UPI0024BC5635|nr:ABC transporter ATP-binding protein [Lentilactobacillus sp. Marseille-Q4993]